MSQSTKEAVGNPVAELDAAVVTFRAQFGDQSPLDQIIRDGAQRMLQAAIEAEVDEFVARHADRRDPQGKRLVVRNGYKPGRTILTGAGQLEVVSTPDRLLSEAI